jgi:hypothetical protein
VKRASQPFFSKGISLKRRRLNYPPEEWRRGLLASTKPQHLISEQD